MNRRIVEVMFERMKRRDDQPENCWSSVRYGVAASHSCRLMVQDVAKAVFEASIDLWNYTVGSA